MTDRELMQQALEALEILTDGYDGTEVGIEIDAITALRQALEEREPYPFAGEIKMEKVIKDGKEVNLLKPTVETPMAYTFTPHDREWVTGKEWARIDKDMNVVHLDMELCAKGPHNAYTALALAIWNKAIETEREKVAQWMMAQGYSTGHGDTLENLLAEIEWQIEDRIKNIIRAKTTYAMQNDLAESVEPDEESDK